MKKTTTRRQGERQGRRASTTARPTERRGEQSSILPTLMFKQLGEDIFRIGEDLRVPIANLARNAVDTAFRVAKVFTHQIGALFGAVIDEADRARENVSRRVRDRAAD